MKKLDNWKSKLRLTSRNLPLVWCPTLLLLLLVGCSSLTSPAKIIRATTGPAMVLANGLYQRGESLTSLAVRGGASFTSQGKRNYFKFEALVLKPGYMLFTAFDPAGRPAFKLASDGKSLTGILYGARQYAMGPATKENFGKFLPLGITPNQLTALLSGAQVRPASAGDKSTAESTELVILPLDKPDSLDNLWVIRLDGPVTQDPALARITSASLGPPKDPSIAIKYRAIKDVPREDLAGIQEPFPHSLEISWVDQDKKELRVTYEEVRLGVPLDTTLFNLAQPKGFELIQLY